MPVIAVVFQQPVLEPRPSSGSCRAVARGVPGCASLGCRGTADRFQGGLGGRRCICPCASGQGTGGHCSHPSLGAQGFLGGCYSLGSAPAPRLVCFPAGDMGHTLLPARLRSPGSDCRAQVWCPQQRARQQLEGSLALPAAGPVPALRNQFVSPPTPWGWGMWLGLWASSCPSSGQRAQGGGQGAGGAGHCVSDSSKL